MFRVLRDTYPAPNVLFFTHAIILTCFCGHRLYYGPVEEELETFIKNVEHRMYPACEPYTCSELEMGSGFEDEEEKTSDTTATLPAGTSLAGLIKQAKATRKFRTHEEEGDIGSNKKRRYYRGNVWQNVMDKWHIYKKTIVQDDSVEKAGGGGPPKRKRCRS